MKYQVRIGDQSFSVEIETLAARPIIAMVDGVRFEVWPENDPTLANESSGCADIQVLPQDKQPAAPTGETSAGKAPKAVFRSKTVNAPIPGVIVEVLVRPGELVEHAQPLFVIEAMKMRNQIRSPRKGEVSAVFVATGQTVNHNTPLLEFQE